MLLSRIRNVLAVAGFCGLAAANSGVDESDEGSIHVCTVYPRGGTLDDTPNIVKAFNICGNNGKIVFPEGETYWIATKLNPVVNNVIIEWRGVWQYSSDLSYWRNNSYPIAFQNHHAGFILTGDGIYIDGYGTGGIDGNGDLWYTAEAGTTLPGRPMPFVFWNVSDVTVSDFFVRQPQLWSLNIMNGTDMYFKNINNTAIATKAPYGKNWVQNTDGFDTMDAKNIYLDGLNYQGGDDCIALKPRSYNIYVSNVTCTGGNGIAVGSLGQYLEDSSVENVVVDNVNIIRYNNDMENGAYIKTWVGALVPQTSYESAYLPRGDGWGSVRNVLFSNFNLQGPSIAMAITEDSGDVNGTYAGTSQMEISNIAFVNFTGYTVPSSSHPYRVGEVSCSKVHPCFNIEFENFNVAPQNGTVAEAQFTCAYIETGGVHGESCTS